MANNYSVTSLTLYPKNKELPLKLGKLGTYILQIFAGNYSKETSPTYVIDEDGLGSQDYSAVFEALIEWFELDDSECSLFEDLAPQLSAHLDPTTLTSLMALVGTIPLFDDSCTDIHELLACCFHEPDSNFGSFYSETGCWCSKPRHGEFGGSGAFYSAKFDAIVYSGQLADLGNKPMDVAVPDYILEQVTKLLLSIKDESLRTSVVKQLRNLS